MLYGHWALLVTPFENKLYASRNRIQLCGDRWQWMRCVKQCRHATSCYHIYTLCFTAPTSSMNCLFVRWSSRMLTAGKLTFNRTLITRTRNNLCICTGIRSIYSFRVFRLIKVLLFLNSTDRAPTDPKAQTVGTQFMWGDALLITPVLTEGARTVTGYFPAATLPNLSVRAIWYDLRTGELKQGNNSYNLNAPLDTIPLHVRGGAILPTQKFAQTTYYAYALPKSKKAHAFLIYT